MHTARRLATPPPSPIAPCVSARHLPLPSKAPLKKPESYKIAQIGGDGIGPEVINAGVQVLNAVAKKAGFSLDFTDLDWSSDRYKTTGKYLPEDYIEVLRQHDAILYVVGGRAPSPPSLLLWSI